MTDILIADDEAEPRDSVVEMLEDEGYAVRVAKDGGEALALYAEKRPDLLLLDIKMPVKTGWDVCRDIRRMDKSLPIILLSAFGEEDDKVRGLTIGADDYIVKDCGARELLARVKRQLGRVVQIAAEQNRAAQTAAQGVAFDCLWCVSWGVSGGCFGMVYLWCISVHFIRAFSG